MNLVKPCGQQVTTRQNQDHLLLESDVPSSLREELAKTRAKLARLEAMQTNEDRLAQKVAEKDAGRVSEQQKGFCSHELIPSFASQVNYWNIVVSEVLVLSDPSLCDLVPILLAAGVGGGYSGGAVPLLPDPASVLQAL
jgi:hypothetical protein